MNELLVTLLLAPLLAVSLDREPLQMLVATDAAPEYGFGMSTCSCDAKTAMEVCRLAERRGDYVRLAPARGDPTEVARLGSPHRLPQTQLDFKTVMSAKAKWTAHSGVLEAHAHLLALRWLARQPKKHHRKIPFLIDAKAVIGAAAKGRSSARALRTILRAAASLCLASDLLPRLEHIPSESNPADKPSRGLRKQAFPTGRSENLEARRVHSRVCSGILTGLSRPKASSNAGCSRKLFHLRIRSPSPSLTPPLGSPGM